MYWKGRGKKMPSLGIGLHGVMKWLLHKRLLIIWRPHKFLKIGCWLLTCWPVICDPALSSASPAPAGDNSWGDTRILGGGSREEIGATVRRDTGNSYETHQVKDPHDLCSRASASGKSPLWCKTHTRASPSPNRVEKQNRLNQHVSREEWMREWRDPIRWAITQSWHTGRPIYLCGEPNEL